MEKVLFEDEKFKITNKAVPPFQKYQRIIYKIPSNKKYPEYCFFHEMFEKTTLNTMPEQLADRLNKLKEPECAKYECCPANNATSSFYDIECKSCRYLNATLAAQLQALKAENEELKGKLGGEK